MHTQYTWNFPVSFDRQNKWFEDTGTGDHPVRQRLIFFCAGQLLPREIREGKNPVRGKLSLVPSRQIHYLTLFFYSTKPR